MTPTDTAVSGRICHWSLPGSTLPLAAPHHLVTFRGQLVVENGLLLLGRYGPLPLKAESSVPPTASELVARHLIGHAISYPWAPMLRTPVGPLHSLYWHGGAAMLATVPSPSITLTARWV